MMIHRRQFNTYLLLLALATLGHAGCETSEAARQKKESTRLRFHLQANPRVGGATVPATIDRANPATLLVSETPFLDERDVDRAELMNLNGAYAIKVQFNRHGVFALDSASVTDREHKIAVFAQFGEGRWLGTITLSRRITDGTVMFAVDASPEEAERIVRGLNNTVARLKKKTF